MLNRMFFLLLFNVVYKMKCSILWKKNKQTCPLCYRLRSDVTRFRTRWRRWDTCYSMDTWQNKQTPKFHRNRKSKSLMQCITESLAASQICPFHRCQLIHGSQPLDHCWRNKNKKRLTARFHQRYYASCKATSTTSNSQYVHFSVLLCALLHSHYCI